MGVREKPTATTTTLERPAPDESQITALINKGGSVATRREGVERTRNVQLRLPESLIPRIDSNLANRLPKPSRHSWLLEAIFEKLERGT